MVTLPKMNVQNNNDLELIRVEGQAASDRAVPDLLTY